MLSIDEKLALCKEVAEECIQEDELRVLFETKEIPIAYDGFEPSGRMHIAQGVMKVLNVNRLTKAGCHFKFWIADWFAMLNNKLGRDLMKIKEAGEKMIDIWKVMGMDISKVEFIWASEEIEKRSSEYWPLVMDIASKNNLKRIIRCSQIMGRKETDELAASQIFYPCMQAADIFFLKADICQLGMDQRKVNMLAREYCDTVVNQAKPVILSHHMLPGLLKGQEKMAKSDPRSAIFMDDSEDEVTKKIRGSYCPPGNTSDVNPCLEYVKYIVLPWFGKFETVNKVYLDMQYIIDDYNSGILHPLDLKNALAIAINKILEPVRNLSIA